LLTNNEVLNLKTGIITKVAGPLVIAEGMRDANMFDVVRVSEQRLIGEIIEMHGDRASIQVYEETSGLGPGETVESTGAPLSVELGPGLIGAIYDGIQRPLDEIMKVAGTNLKRGVDVPSLNHSKKWAFKPVAKTGDKVTAGTPIALVGNTGELTTGDHLHFELWHKGQTVDPTQYIKF
jgi:V/A-type H+-transporting ATPase subunit A